LIGGRGYPLINGYSYTVPESGHHLIEGNYRKIELGYHLNRIYINDRYIIGEITERPGKANQYSFFIFDTKTADYTSNLTQHDFDVEIGRRGIEEVNLVGRDDKDWLKKQ
jgi:hypothetical protein